MVVVSSEYRIEDLGTVYIASKEKLNDYDIVESDRENPGMVKKQHRKLPLNRYEAFLDLNKKVLGFVVPDKINGLKKDDYMIYKIDIERDWKRYDH